MPRSRLFAALPLLAALLGGCVVVPTTPAHVQAPITAGLSQIKVVVPQSTSTPGATVAWNKARLTIQSQDGRVPATAHLLEARDGGLELSDAIGDLPPGQYTVHMDLLQDLPGGAERVVATGVLDGDAAKLHAGANNLAVMVHPTQPGTHVALAPTELYTSHGHDDWHTSVSSDDDTTTALAAAGAIVLGEAIVGALSTPSSPPASPPAAPASPDALRSDGSTPPARTVGESVGSGDASWGLDSSDDTSSDNSDEPRKKTVY